MKIGRFLMVVNIVVTMLLLHGMHTYAQGSPAPSGVGPQQGNIDANPVSAEFSYQGQLSNDDGPVNASCDFRFELYTQQYEGDGIQIGKVIEKINVPVRNGSYAVELDFGDDVFDGYSRFIQVAVKCPGDAEYVKFQERQPILATPYAAGLKSKAVLHEPSIRKMTILQAIRVEDTPKVPDPLFYAPAFVLYVPYSLANSVYIDNLLTNGDPDALLYVTARQMGRTSDGDVIPPFGVQYDTQRGMWEIYLLNTGDGFSRLTQASFNILVIKRCDPLKPLVVGCGI